MNETISRARFKSTAFLIEGHQETIVYAKTGCWQQRRTIDVLSLDFDHRVHEEDRDDRTRASNSRRENYFRCIDDRGATGLPLDSFVVLDHAVRAAFFVRALSASHSFLRENVKNARKIKKSAALGAGWSILVEKKKKKTERDRRTRFESNEKDLGRQRETSETDSLVIKAHFLFLFLSQSFLVFPLEIYEISVEADTCCTNVRGNRWIRCSANVSLHDTQNRAGGTRNLAILSCFYRGDKVRLVKDERSPWFCFDT